MKEIRPPYHSRVTLAKENFIVQETHRKKNNPEDPLLMASGDQWCTCTNSLRDFVLTTNRLKIPGMLGLGLGPSSGVSENRKEHRIGSLQACVKV